MKCPVCLQPDLVMSERQGIEIDYCPQCRGVWLDRGELDKIVERSAAQPATPPAPQPAYGEPRVYDRHREYDRDYHHKKKRRGFLGEIFDFD
ncbi:MAG TPA: zf-TFIIB domain-containing protein [Longimicrobiaceae bacterium]|nr:zf-TFIIB domain-containing protein [Longimicrobiaceae bacterium]